MAYGSKVAAAPRLVSIIIFGRAGGSSTLADVRRRYSIAQGGSGIMIHIVIEYFLENSLEFTDLRTRGARWRGRRTFRTSRHNQKCNQATGALLPTPS